MAATAPKQRPNPPRVKGKSAEFSRFSWAKSLAHGDDWHTEKARQPPHVEVLIVTIYPQGEHGQWAVILGSATSLAATAAAASSSKVIGWGMRCSATFNTSSMREAGTMVSGDFI